MKILVLEDKPEKLAKIKSEILSAVPNADVVAVGNWLDYSTQVHSKRFDLILLDLWVPRSPRDPRLEDHSVQLIETTRGTDSKSRLTPAIVLTGYLADSEEFFQELNKVDINVISFDDEGGWKAALRNKIRAAEPKIHFDFLIICALAKEAQAYELTCAKVGPVRTIADLLCREVTIGNYSGAIVQLPRTGLVAAAVSTAYAVERFQPKLVCMSGICGGVPPTSSIYDLLITESCHQHDIGKWSDAGFKSEHYDIQLRPAIRGRLEELASDNHLLERIAQGMDLTRSEFPETMEKFEFAVRMAPMSSGSAVIAEQGHTQSLAAGQRKLAGFDMEIFSVFEAARLSALEPSFFAVKSVVDDGDKHKGDRFHRVGAILSARFVVEAISSGIVDL